jgi:signal transduction histidine kinase
MTETLFAPTATDVPPLSSTPVASPSTRSPSTRPGGRRFAQGLAYTFFNAVISLAVFIITIVFFCLGWGLLILYIGLLLLIACFGLAHGYAALHRGLLAWQGHSIETLPPLPSRHGLWTRLKAQLKNPERWREIGLASGGALLLAIISLFSIGWFGFGVQQLISPLIPGLHGLVEGVRPDVMGGSSLGVFNSSHWWDTVIGVGLLVTWPGIAWLVNHANIGLAKAFLSPSRQAMERRIAGLAAARAATSTAETQSLRHIERDIHDGPQQRLIRTGMDLAAAQRRLDAGDIEAARALLNEAKARNDETIQELRQLARGFAPPILAERGLATALASLAGTSPIPARVHLRVDADRRYNDAAERAVYFAAAEAIANAAKHSTARHIDLTLEYVEAAHSAQLRLQARDDGQGGAVTLPGHGLDGLRARITGVEGKLTIDSPQGQGTTLTVSIPLVKDA